MSTMWRSRWAAVGAAVAITLGAGGIGIVDATKSSGERAVYTAIEPCRLLDTRADQGIGGRTTPLGPGEVYTITAHGNNGQCTGIPNDTLALELNVTGLQNTGNTHFTIWSGAGAVPNASHVNLAPGARPTPNSVTTELDGAKFAIRNNSATANVIIDIVGIYQDHNHDDRYYTETESDDRYYTKSESNTRFDDVQADVWSENDNTQLTSTDVVIGSVTVQTPTSGYVMVDATGYIFEQNNAVARCSITTGTSIDTAALSIAETTTDNAYFPMALSRNYTINYGLFPLQTLEKTYNLVCDSTVGTPDLVDPQLSVTFVPDPDAFSVIILPFPDEAPGDPLVDGVGG